MKKKNFFNGLSAKLALAIVALTGAMFTSCTKESFDVTATGMPDAQGKIDVTVICGTENVTGAMTISDHSVTVKADGTVDSKTYTITAVSKTGEYTNGEATITFPALTKGQIYVYPVTIYVQPISEKVTYTVVEDPTVKPEPSQDTPKTTDPISAGDTPMVYSVKYPVQEGSIVENYNEIKAQIDNLNARSFTLDQIKAAMTQILNDLNKGFSTYTNIATVTVPAQTTYVPTYHNTYSTTVNAISMEDGDGNTYIVSGIKIKKATGTILELVDNSHGHDHGHGDGGNDGGGSAGK